jgi:hypothetical protein
MMYRILSISILTPFVVFAAPVTTQPSGKAAIEKNVPPDLVDQTDTTDTLAIPFDESEEEEEVEENNLEQMQKKLEQQASSSAKNQSTTKK